MSGQWQPRPDPALDDPKPKGLHVHQHPSNRLHAWAFLQHQVWVDYWGNEHEIESMPIEYVENVIAFCRGQAAGIRLQIALSAAAEALSLCKAGSEEEARQWFDLALSVQGDPVESLEQTPLFRALRRRRSAGNAGGETPGTAEREQA